MKLIKFGVNNFRAISGGLENNQINFRGSNTIFIFGQNNVGKSTFLAAYDFFFNDKVPSLNDFHKRDENGVLEFEIELGVDEVDLLYIEQKQSKKLDSFREYLNYDSTIRIKRTYSLSIIKDKPSISKATDQTFNPAGGKWDNSAFGSIGLIQVFQTLMPTPILIKAMPTEQEVENVVNEILASKAKSKLNEKEFAELNEAQKRVRELQAKMYNPVSIDRYKEEVNKHFQLLFPDTLIEIADSDKVKWTEDKFGKKFNVEFKKQNSDGSLDESTPSSYNTIGHGAVRSAIFSLLLMRDIAEELPRHADRKEYLILFEEPELFLYPKILKSLRELVYAVSDLDYPYQVLCASHSPQMIDISKRNSTLIRMVKVESGTKLYQISDGDLQEANGARSFEDLKQAMYEVLRFNPHICESFYADEVLLVEGPTEEILIRGILQRLPPSKDLFIVNCGTVNNIPFYQKVYRKFAIKSHIICDTDSQEIRSLDNFTNPVFDKGIQSSIYNEHWENCNYDPKIGGLLRVHDTTFEVAHSKEEIHSELRYPNNLLESHGKPYNANRYWLDILSPNFDSEHINSVPIIAYLKEILSYKWNSV
ncbi:ATP-dependent nuclease [Pseudobacter ginsenosidimutans]|uniref:Putative ATP-dependent endonuclease of OLD family n=1 Tax=Pseudobacter ginsenosidimutans TaxID=661488 RepID=A0A4Q7MS95_9BACT|nr:AAA family ATPase [Pseudobacter ginsenosidimutans]QEC41560.1 AAA family ATPase [Pseudobacter ginsenosidimutans]RZS71655.1 putative ATP-dependent endonuclease of OLD family [Pseudobacter ginsenosidimutans]